MRRTGSTAPTHSHYRRFGSTLEASSGHLLARCRRQTNRREPANPEETHTVTRTVTESPLRPAAWGFPQQPPTSSRSQRSTHSRIVLDSPCLTHPIRRGPSHTKVAIHPATRGCISRDWRRHTDARNGVPHGGWQPTALSASYWPLPFP